MHEKEYMKELAISGGALPWQWLLENEDLLMYNYWHKHHRQRLALIKVNGMKADMGFDDNCKLDQSRSSHSILIP